MITTGSTSSYFGRSCSTGGVIAPHQKDNNLKLEMEFSTTMVTVACLISISLGELIKIEELVYTVPLDLSGEPFGP